MDFTDRETTAAFTANICIYRKSSNKGTLPRRAIPFERLSGGGECFEIIAILHIYRPRSEGDNVIGSVRPSVCVFVRALLFTPFEGKGGHYQSEGFVCVSVIRGRMRIISRMRPIGF